MQENNPSSSKIGVARWWELISHHPLWSALIATLVGTLLAAFVAARSGSVFGNSSVVHANKHTVVPLPTTVTIRQARPEPKTPARARAPAPRPTTAPDTWPAATSAWTVILVSSSTVAGAEAVQARAVVAKLAEPGLLLSSRHSSLRAGYWVAFTGVLSHDDAVARAREARAAGFSDAYARYVSAT